MLLFVNLLSGFVLKEKKKRKRENIYQKFSNKKQHGANLTTAAVLNYWQMGKIKYTMY